MADKEIFSLAMDNLEDFPVDLDNNDDNFNVDLNNEDQNFNLDTAQEDEDFTVDFGEVINLGTTDYERLQHLPQINGVTLIGNKTTEDLGISTDSSYDASWLFGAIDSTATQAQYNELYQAVQDKVRIVLSTEGQTFNAQAYLQDSNNVSVIMNVGAIMEYDDNSYAQNIVGIFSVDGQTKSVSLQVGETDGAAFAEDIAYLSSNLSAEVRNRQNADNNLQSQIDAISASSDVVDVLGTYAELQQYDTSHLKDNDIVKVLQDSTHSNAMSYYRWVVSGGTGSFQYVGSEGPFYTKGEVDTKVNTNLGGQSFTTVQSALETLISEFANALDTKQNEITSSYKLASDLVDDTNQTNKFVTSAEKTAWNNKADYGFYGIIDGTSANPTDGATLANGVYKASESQNASYISLPMEDGTTKKQSVQKGGIVIRTTARLIVFATQNLMYQYDTSNHYFYPAESFIESTLRREYDDGLAYLGTVTPPNNVFITTPITELEATINTGDTGHVRITFTVDSSVAAGDFGLSLTGTDGNGVLYEDGKAPVPKGGETWILEFYGKTCEPLRFTDTAIADVVNYNDLTNKPVISHKTTSIASRTVTVGTTNTTIQGTQAIDTLAGFQFIPLDMSEYTSGAANKALLPEKHLPHGVYVVTASGYMRVGTDQKKLEIGSLIYWFDSGELDLIGYNACEYWSYDSKNDEWSGGYFTTTDDVDYAIAEKIGWQIVSSALVAGTATMTDGRWSRRSRETGVNSLTITFPSQMPDYNYKSKLTCRTSSTFTTFNVTARNYKIYFYGDDCVDGVLTGVAGKYYEMEASHDGFDGLTVEVHSHALPTT